MFGTADCTQITDFFVCFSSRWPKATCDITPRIISYYDASSQTNKRLHVKTRCAVKRVLTLRTFLCMSEISSYSVDNMLACINTSNLCSDTGDDHIQSDYLTVTVSVLLCESLTSVQFSLVSVCSSYTDGKPLTSCVESHCSPPSSARWTQIRQINVFINTHLNTVSSVCRN